MLSGCSSENDASVIPASELSKLPFIETLTIQQGKYANLSAISALTNLKMLTIDGVTLTTEELKAMAGTQDFETAFVSIVKEERK